MLFRNINLPLAPSFRLFLTNTDYLISRSQLSAGLQLSGYIVQLQKNRYMRKSDALIFHFFPSGQRQRKCKFLNAQFNPVFEK